MAEAGFPVLRGRNDFVDLGFCPCSSYASLRQGDLGAGC